MKYFQKCNVQEHRRIAQAEELVILLMENVFALKNITVMHVNVRLFVRSFCTKLLYFFFNYILPVKECPKISDLVCNSKGVCNEGNGTCKCNKGFSGDACNGE